MNTKGIFGALLGLILLLPGPAASGYAAFGQAIDPFYLKSLKDGESQLLAKRYKEASESLEIAAFGLHAKKDALARARVYLALCYAYMNESAKAEQNLKGVQAILGTEGLRSFDLPEPGKTDLAKLIRIFGLNKPAAPMIEKPTGRTTAPTPTAVKAAEAPPAKPETAPPASKPAAGLSSEAMFEEAIRREPRQAEPYYALARLQVEAKDFSGAKATLIKLLENNQAEIRGYLELGRIAYGERRLKDAEKSLDRFLELKNNVRVDRRLVLEAKVLLALSSSLRGDSKKALASLKDAAELGDPAFREGLGLASDDLDRLSRLLNRKAG